MKKTAISTLLMLLLMQTGVWAQQKESIELKSKAEVEVATANAKGEKQVKRVDAARARVAPGDTVIFTTSYTNIGKQPAADVEITNPMPKHMVYLDKSAGGKGTRIEFSVDNGKTYALPGELTVKNEQGKVRAAGPVDYTHIKWTLNSSLPAGGKGSVWFRAKVK